MISRQLPNVAVSKLSDTAIIPKRGSTYAAGLDLYTPTSGVVQPGKRLLVNLDIAIELPSGTFGHILPRSGLALKNGIHIGAGVIVEDYRGNVGVLLFNFTSSSLVVSSRLRTPTCSILIWILISLVFNVVAEVICWHVMVFLCSKFSILLLPLAVPLLFTSDSILLLLIVLALIELRSWLRINPIIVLRSL